MAKEKFLLLSLKEDKAKKIAQVISNVTCRKILEYLAEKEATETELAEKLNLPISTVHYNLQQLVDSNLVVIEEFHYSKKGREVNHYKLANKYVIIAPKSTFGIKEKLRSILPVIGLTIITAGFLHFFSRYFAKGEVVKTLTTITKTVGGDAFRVAEPVIEKVATTGVVEEAVEEAIIQAPAAAQKVAENVTTSAVTTTIPASPLANIALWFFIGALFSLIIYFVLGYVKKKREK